MEEGLFSSLFRRDGSPGGRQEGSDGYTVTRDPVTDTPAAAGGQTL